VVSMASALAKLKKQAKKEAAAQRPLSAHPSQRPPSAVQGPPPSKKVDAMKKVESENEANINTVFGSLVGNVPISERGSIVVNPDAPTILEAAHKWGLLRIHAETMVREQNRYGASNSSVVHFPSIVPKGASNVDEIAYKRGYVLWYLCGRQVLPKNLGDVDGQLTELVEYTKTISNAQGSAAPRFQTPTTRKQLNEYASAAFAVYKTSEERRQLAEARSSASERIAGKRPLGSVEAVAGKRSSIGAGSSSNDRVVAQKPSVPPPGPSMAPPSAPKMHPEAGLDSVLVSFLKDPNDQYTFSASKLRSIEETILTYMAKDSIFSVVKRDETSTITNFREIVFSPMEGIFVKGERLYNVLDNHFNLDSASSWANAFASLNLVLEGKGTYNSVWRLKRNEAGTGPASADQLYKFFPREVADALVADSHVLRVPMPDAWESFDNVKQEMVNVCEAALHQFGPRIAAMWVGRRSYPVDRVSGREDSEFKLFMVIERGRDVHKRLYHLTRIKAERSIWIRYLKSLRRCVWRYSANRCLPLDGKLGNFVDTFPDKMTGSRDEGRVNAIDMDGTYYRRVRRQTAEEGTLDNPASPNMAQGWKLVWLYNILFVSCNLRMILDSTTYFNLWWNDLKGPISAVMIDARLLRGAPTGTRDAEYVRARDFLAKCLWKGTFKWSRIPDDPPMEDTAEALAKTALDLVMHYFHDFPYKEARRRLIDTAIDVRKKRHELRQAKAAGATDAEVRVREAGIEQSRANRNQQWAAWYGGEFRTTLLPMIRMFTNRLVVPGDIGTPVPMVQVLWEYSKATDTDLYPLIEGRHPPGVIGGPAIRWPRVRRWEECTEAWLNDTEWEHEPTARVALGFA
jgi:hypothetical protein